MRDFQVSWMVKKSMENPKKQWMITGGTPMT